MIIGIDVGGTKASALLVDASSASVVDRDRASSTGDGPALVAALASLVAALRDRSPEPVEAVGEPFDPNLHEAISQQHTDEAAEGTVLQQVQRGYKLNDRLVRPARVIVAAALVEEAEPTDN